MRIAHDHAGTACVGSKSECVDPVAQYADYCSSALFPNSSFVAADSAAALLADNERSLLVSRWRTEAESSHLAVTSSVTRLQDKMDADQQTMEMKLQAEVSVVMSKLVALEDHVDAQVAEIKSSCTHQEYEASLGVCKALAVCSPGEWEKAHPTPTTNRECSTWTSCTSEQYELLPPTRFNDRNCRAWKVCETGVAYEEFKGTASSDRICKAYTACHDTEYEVRTRFCLILDICSWR